MTKRRISPEEYFARYLERFPDNRFNMSPENFHEPMLLQVFECAVHGMKFQIEPYVLVRPTTSVYGCKDCGKEAKSKAMSKQWEDPEFSAMMAEKMSERWEDPEFRAMRSEVSSKTMSENWQNPEFRAMMAEASKERWEDPMFREMMIETINELWQDPEFRAMRSEVMSKQWEDPDYRERMSEVMSKQWQDPEFRAMMAEVLAKGVASNGPSKGVLQIASVLNAWGIEYQGGDNIEDEFIIPDTAYRFDFYLHEYRTFIEYHGEQHFEYTPHFHTTEDDFLDQKARDQWKEEWAYENDYHLIIITHKNINDTAEILAYNLGA